MTVMMLVQATWLSKLHDAQEKYQEVLRSRYRDGVDAAASGVISHVDRDFVVGGPSSEQIVPADVTAPGGWLSAAAAASSLRVPSFAVHDYGELVRDQAQTQKWSRLSQ